MKLLVKMLSGFSLVFIGMFGVAHSAKADISQTYDLAWSGAGNNATATGTITLDLSAINNPGTTGGVNEQSVNPFVTAFTITISGASSGNGTFGFSDFNGSGTFGGFLLSTHGGTLDLSQQLIGQPTPGGPWGSTHDSLTGDFNIFTNGTDPNAPLALGPFQLKTDNGAEDAMDLTSFAPVPSTVPEPSSVILLATSVLLAAALVTRKRPARRQSQATQTNL
jgi:hypothetical protein